MMELLVHDDVLAERALEDPRHLSAVGNMAAARIGCFDEALPATPVQRVELADNCLQEAALARAHTTDDTHKLTLRHCDVQVFQYRLRAGIREASHHPQSRCVLGLHRGLPNHILWPIRLREEAPDAKEAVRHDHRPAQTIRELADVAQQSLNQALHDHDLVCRNLAVACFRQEDPHCDCQHTPRESVCHCCHDTGHHSHRSSAPELTISGLHQLLLGQLLPGQGLDRSDGEERLCQPLQARVHEHLVCPPVLHGNGSAAHHQEQNRHDVGGTTDGIEADLLHHDAEQNDHGEGCHQHAETVANETAPAVHNVHIQNLYQIGLVVAPWIWLLISIGCLPGLWPCRARRSTESLVEHNRSQS
mmetsp:Transcript_110711/g.264063  ORF Transcript_110711/g.264063 Transcript_110711/m.264063 type:complete len:361 (+) Transcript_110711:2729-3811(+)